MTYTQVNWDKKWLLNELRRKLSIDWYLVAKEPHLVSGMHIHVILHLKGRKEISNPTFFNILGVHPEINTLSKKDIKKTRDYCEKNKDFILNYIEKISLEATLMDIAEKEGLVSALCYFRTKTSGKPYLQTLGKTKKSLEAHLNLRKAEQRKQNDLLATKMVPNLSYFSFLKEDKQQTLNYELTTVQSTEVKCKISEV
ncbi:MAG: DNA-binding phage protein [Saprospiraceae bacterium]